MPAITRWSVRTLAATAVLGIAAVTAQAQPVRFPTGQPVRNPIVIPQGPRVNPAAIPQVPTSNPVRVMPQINSFPGFPTYPANNPFTPSLSGNPFSTPYTNPQRINNPVQFTNPFVNPFNPLNNPLVNNNPLLLNPLVFNNQLVNANPFVNPLLTNPFAVNPLTPFAQPIIGVVQPAAYQPGTLVMAGPNTFVNNATGAVVQPITGTTFADGTTFYRAPTIGTTLPGLPRFGNNIFTPYIW